MLNKLRNTDSNEMDFLLFLNMETDVTCMQRCLKKKQETVIAIIHTDLSKASLLY